MARIGDIYADRELFAQACPLLGAYPQVSPGQSRGYLEAATIYWDYFDFENALRLLTKGRERLAEPSYTHTRREPSTKTSAIIRMPSANT